MAIPPARLISQHLHTIPGKLKVAEFFFDVPLDYSKPTDKQIRLFARSAEKLETPIVPTKVEKASPTTSGGEQLPWMVYVTGGPGFGAPQPQDAGFTSFILDRGYKVLFWFLSWTRCCSPQLPSRKSLYTVSSTSMRVNQ
jgi:hypothetical protein